MIWVVFSDPSVTNSVTTTPLTSIQENYRMVEGVFFVEDGYRFVEGSFFIGKGYWFVKDGGIPFEWR